MIRPGGKLILTAPFCSLTHFAPFHFSTGFNRFFYKTHLPAHGLKILELTENGDFFDYLAQELHRTPEIARKYASDGPTRWERYALTVVFRMLQRFHDHNRGSQELLTFGLHVLAEKE